MRTWVERVPLGVGFAGRAGPGGLGPPSLDRIKTMKQAGWELTVLTVKGERYVLLVGYREEREMRKSLREFGELVRELNREYPEPPGPDYENPKNAFSYEEFQRLQAIGIRQMAIQSYFLHTMVLEIKAMERVGGVDPQEILDAWEEVGEIILGRSSLELELHDPLRARFHDEGLSRPRKRALVICAWLMGWEVDEIAVESGYTRANVVRIIEEAPE